MDVASIAVVVRPGVTDWLTAVGTVAVAIAAVGVAFFAEWRAGVRVADERDHAAKVLADERAAADDRLGRQLDQAREREQFDEAYAVQVVLGDKAAGSQWMTSTRSRTRKSGPWC